MYVNMYKCLPLSQLTPSGSLTRLNEQTQQSLRFLQKKKKKKILWGKLLIATFVLHPLLLLQVKHIAHGLGDSLLSFPDRCAQRVPKAGSQVAAGQKLQQVPRVDGSGRWCSAQSAVLLFRLTNHTLNVPWWVQEQPEICIFFKVVQNKPFTLNCCRSEGWLKAAGGARCSTYWSASGLQMSFPGNGDRAENQWVCKGG